MAGLGQVAPLGLRHRGRGNVARACRRGGAGGTPALRLLTTDFERPEISVSPGVSNSGSKCVITTIRQLHSAAGGGMVSCATEADRKIPDRDFLSGRTCGEKKLANQKKTVRMTVTKTWRD